MKKKKTKIIIPPTKTTKSQELMYQKELMKLGRSMSGAVRVELLPFLYANKKGYTIDSFSTQLNLIMKKLNQYFSGIVSLGFAQTTATQMVEKLNDQNKQKFDGAIVKATGVDYGSVIQEENLQDFIDLNINKNISLIENMPDEYLKQIEIVVNNGVASGQRYSEIANQITSRVGSVNSKLSNRIKLIARNETQTIAAQINVRRSAALGIKKGIFLTSDDERVRTCHAELNHKEFDLKKGAWSKTCKKFIQPGITDINCRCGYASVLEI